MDSKALLQSELRYRRLFQAALEGILMVDPETRRIIEVNPFLAALLGYQAEEVTGRELFEIGLFKDEAACQAAFRELMETGTIRYENLPLETRDGRRVEVEFVSTLYLENDRQVIQCTVRDISARVRAETALRESEERFQLVARAMSDAIWDRNLTTGELWWSDGFQTAFGYGATGLECGIESWTSRIHPDDRERVDASVHHAIECGGNTWSMEYRFRCRGGHYTVVCDSGYILRDASGKGIRMVGGMRDLSHQKKLEAHYLRAQRLEGIGALAGGIAHDLNNMLTPIMMSIGLLQQDAGDDPARSEILGTIQGSCQRGADLVRHMLAFARGRDGERIAVRLHRLIGDLKGMIVDTFPRNITIVTHVEDDLWPILGDSTQLFQVLLNLAVNARDAMPEGGTLTLNVANSVFDPHHNGTIRKSSPARWVIVDVCDTGHGIPLEFQGRIFEPFFTTKEMGKGTGLGLAIVRTIVTRHGGLVSVQSQVGCGTTFRVCLPVETNDTSVDTLTTPDIDLVCGRNELVLVVDDEPWIRTITRQTLEAFGYRVITASDGAEAVALYTTRGSEIAVVLTDIMMPTMGAAAMIQVLRRINPLVRIIAVSGFEITENAVKAARAGVDDFLAKPFTARALIDMLREVIDRPLLVSTNAEAEPSERCGSFEGRAPARPGLAIDQPGPIEPRRTAGVPSSPNGKSATRKSASDR